MSILDEFPRPDIDRDPDPERLRLALAAVFRELNLPDGSFNWMFLGADGTLNVNSTLGTNDYVIPPPPDVEVVVDVDQADAAADAVIATSNRLYLLGARYDDLTRDQRRVLCCAVCDLVADLKAGGVL